MQKILALALALPALAFTSMHSSDAEAARIVVVTGKSAKAPKHRVFVPAHWEIKAGKRVWVAGHFKLVPAGKSLWIPGHWEMRRGKRVWVAGYWK